MSAQLDNVVAASRGNLPSMPSFIDYAYFGYDLGGQAGGGGQTITRAPAPAPAPDKKSNGLLILSALLTVAKFL